MLSNFKRTFWRPPRAHGETIGDRSVGFIELFYDLVYVVVIARATHHLAAHLTGDGVFEFAVIFGMIWFAWLNGTLYHDLHGGEDGRSRTYIFIQMLIVALLGVFTEDAASEGGTGFAATYTLFLLVLSWQWYTVRRIDADEYMSVTGRYLAGMLASVLVIGASAFFPADLRIYVWAAFIGGWLVLQLVIGPAISDLDLTFTDSTVERFGLFTIIVLGEVVVGVVTGLSEVERTVESIATGLLGLMVGFGIWWCYFDFVGRRMPRSDRGVGSVWMASHFPITMGIAASGAALVNLVEHAADDRAPEAAALLLGGSVATTLVFLAVTLYTLRDFERLQTIYRPQRRPVGVRMTGASSVLAHRVIEVPSTLD